MDRAMLEDHLKHAEEHISLGEHHLAHQREVIETLRRDGHDTTTAVDLLATFEQLQAAHIADRDRIMKELSTVNKSVS